MSYTVYLRYYVVQSQSSDLQTELVVRHAIFRFVDSNIRILILNILLESQN